MIIRSVVLLRFKALRLEPLFFCIDDEVKRDKK